MKLVNLILDNFGPFKSYEVSFVREEHSCTLLTGKNNEGKSNIILALKLLSAATRVIGRSQSRIVIEEGVFYRLAQTDVEGLLIGRLLHNYQGNQATIHGLFDNGFRIHVILDSNNGIIYADYEGHNPKYLENTFGIIPPLGPLAEKEELLSLKHIKSSISTTLAPRHLRNHFAQILTPEEYQMVQEIIRASWPSIELLNWERNINDDSLQCFFKEDRIDRELCWAGQGLQVWFQIVTHLVRLRNSSMIVLDEPEINLHPEKQNDLIRLLQEYFAGNVLIATHSVELMNNVSVSHIIHVQKKQKNPTIKSTTDRPALEVMRSQIGSTFNLIASQFESVDRIIFTEDTLDYKILNDLAVGIGKKANTFNIPIHGFSEYRKGLSYKDAYKLLIGRDSNYVMVLDRDYYPEFYLNKVRTELTNAGIRLVLTPGKEIENIFLSPEVLNGIIPMKFRDEWSIVWDKLFDDLYVDCQGSLITLHAQFITPRQDPKTIITQFMPDFNTRWHDQKIRYLNIAGKVALQKLRGFYQDRFGKNLTQKTLIDAVVKYDRKGITQFVNDIFNT